MPLWFASVQAQIPGHLNALNTAGTSIKLDAFTYTYSVGETVTFNNSCAFTPGVIQPTCICLVPTTEVFDEKFKANFFPNPTSSHVVVETDFPDFANYSITSLDGKTVLSAKFNYEPIGLGGLPPGSYFLRLSTDDNQIFKTVKIIKQ